MNTRPLVILGSARSESDTKGFLDKILERTPHSLIVLLDEEIAYYNYEGKYPATDRFMKITDQMLEHDVIIFATPVYWYAMSGLLKVFFDRFTDIVTIEKHIGRKLKGKRMLLVSVGADEELPPGFEAPFKLTADYLEMIYAGSIYYSMQHPQEEEQLNEAMEQFIKLIG